MDRIGFADRIEIVDLLNYPVGEADPVHPVKFFLYLKLLKKLRNCSYRSLQEHIIESHVLNLHQLSHGAAFVALLIILELERTSRTSDRFTLIPGKSGQMSSFILEKIREMLPELSCEVDPKNSGRLIVQRKINF